MYFKNGFKFNRKNLSISFIIIFIGVFWFLSIDSFSSQKSGISTETSDQDILNLFQSERIVKPLGNLSSDITILEFGDYQCVHCAKFNQETKPLIVSKYVNPDKVKFIFKDYPINDNTLNKNASTLAAKASYCANEQNRYWDYHDEIFKNWNGHNNKVWLNQSSLINYASNIGINDIEKFTQCINSDRYDKTITESYKSVRKIGFEGTPVFIILNNKTKDINIIDGAQPFEIFDQGLSKMISN